MRLIALTFLALLGLSMPAGAADICSPCDFDGSGTITVADHAIMLGAFGTKRGDPGFDARVDYDGSGTITIKDWAVYLKFCLSN